MADIPSKLNYSFTDGQTTIMAEHLNAFVDRINKLIDVVSEQPTPTQTVATPTISISGTTATITCSTSGATIYYTLNGNTPTTSSTQYSSPITLPGACTIKAIAVKSGMTDSQVASANYTEQATDITSLFSSWESGGITHSTGAEVASQALVRSGYVDISAYQGKLLTYTNAKMTNSGVSTFGLSFYDASQVCLKVNDKGIVASATEDGYENATVLVPANAKYVRLCWWANSGTGASFYSNFHAEISNAQITDLSSQITSWTDGNYLKYSDGVETTSSNYRYSNDYIDISAYQGKALNYSRIKRDNTNLSAGLIFYDSSQAYLSGERNISNAAENGWQDAVVKIPDNAKYVRMSWYNSTGTGSTWANEYYLKVVTNLTM